jgi:hypothetical protein
MVFGGALLTVVFALLQTVLEAGASVKHFFVQFPAKREIGCIRVVTQDKRIRGRMLT